MDIAGVQSWRVSESRWPEAFELALWVRAAERIDVPAGGAVPGPADLDPLPDPSTRPGDAAELAAGWRAWWEALARTPAESGPDGPRRSLTQIATGGPPDFPLLASWPALQQAVAARWPEASSWRHESTGAGPAGRPRADTRTWQAVRDLEEELGRPARPFALSLVVVSVRDDQVRPLRPGAYLVPEQLHRGPRWPGLLHDLLLPLA